MNSSNRGFTLIELLVVIAIIGILSSVVLASLNTARVRANVASAQASIKQMNLAMQLYLDQTGYLPPSADNCSSCGGATSCNAAQWNIVVSALNSSGTMSNAPAVDPWGAPYCWDMNYRFPNCAAPTILWSSGPNRVNESGSGTTPGGDDVGFTTIAGPQC